MVILIGDKLLAVDCNSEDEDDTDHVLPGTIVQQEVSGHPDQRGSGIKLKKTHLEALLLGCF